MKNNKVKYFTDKVIMVRPSYFSYNEETAESNKFQNIHVDDGKNIRQAALEEFEEMITLLTGHGIDVLIVESDPIDKCPDAVFPNNWISFHEGGTMITYPMLTPNRRRERNQKLIALLIQDYEVTRHVHFEVCEQYSLFLEGTGSIVLDREKKIAYASLSQRTDENLFKYFCKTIAYDACIFDSYDRDGHAIYHTNVMMAMGHDYVVICIEAIADKDKSKVLKAITESGKQLLEITIDQMNNFAGNMLQLKNDKDQFVLVLSKTAFDSLDENQREFLALRNILLSIAIPTIESIGGGSTRCMIAELMLEKQNSNQ